MNHNMTLLLQLLLVAGIVSAFPSTPTKHLRIPAIDVNTIGRHLDLAVEFFSKLYQPLFEGIAEDPAEFYDFVYDLNWRLEMVHSTGEANIKNPIIVGMSNFERRLTINKERREIGLHIAFPEVSLLGNYTLNSWYGGCIIWIGCFEDYHTGSGGYNHTFTGVSFDAKYILDNSTSPDSDGLNSIRYSPFNFSLQVDGCSLYADNYTVNGVPQTHWEERSQRWLEEYITSPEAVRLANVLYGEATAIVLNYSSRILVKSIDQIFEELLGFGAEIVP